MSRNCEFDSHIEFQGVKMTMNCDYDSVVGVILPVENQILPIVHLKLKLTKTNPLLYTFKNTAAVFLLVVKLAAPRIIQKQITSNLESPK